MSILRWSFHITILISMPNPSNEVCCNYCLYRQLDRVAMGYTDMVAIANPTPKRAQLLHNARSLDYQLLNQSRNLHVTRKPTLVRYTVQSLCLVHAGILLDRKQDVCNFLSYAYFLSQCDLIVNCNFLSLFFQVINHLVSVQR